MKYFRLRLMVIVSLPTTILTFVACDRSTPLAVTSLESTPFDVYDTDKSGELSETERKEMNEKFVEHFDTDGDGTLGALERNAARKHSQVNVSVTNGPTETEDTAKSFIKQLDQNGDGMISKEDVDETRWKVFSRSDANQDGQVSAAEWLSRAK